MNGMRNSWNAYHDQDAASSSDEELPVKGKSTFKERSAAVGREAALQKQLQEAARDRQDLAKRYEAKDQKCNELRDKLKVTKAALSSKERELDMAQRLLQKLGQEKGQLRDEVAESKVYTRKLEARLDELKGQADLSSKLQVAKGKAHDLQQQLVTATAELEAARQVVQQRDKEVDRLNRALDIRASELSQEAGGADIPAQLLHSLAESREESLALAKQLAAAKSDVHKLRASAARLNSRVEAAELMRADAEVAAEQLRQRLERLVGSSQEVTKQRCDMAQLLVAARSEAEGYKSERDELAEVVLEMQEECEALKAEREESRTRGHEAVAAAADEAVQHIASSRAVAEELRAQQAQREAELSQHCSHLQRQAEQMQDALQQQLEAAQQQAAARQQQILVLESQMQTRRQRELELERQVAALQAQADKLGGVASSAEAAACRTGHLQQQVIRLEASLRVADVERQQMEQRLQQLGDDAAAAQQEAAREMDGLRVQLAAKEAAHRCAMEDVAELQKQLKQLSEQLDKTSSSKAQLQHNMLHQISSIKERLQQARLHSQQQLSSTTSAGGYGEPERHESGDQDQEVGYGVRSAAAAQLVPRQDGYAGSAGKSGGGGGGGVVSGSASMRSSRQREGGMQHSAGGLADELGREDGSIDWHSILRAAEIPGGRAAAGLSQQQQQQQAARGAVAAAVAERERSRSCSPRPPYSALHSPTAADGRGRLAGSAPCSPTGRQGGTVAAMAAAFEAAMPMRMQGLDEAGEQDDNSYGMHPGSSAGRLAAPQQQQRERERTRSQSGGSSKLQHDPSLSSFLSQPPAAAGDNSADGLHAYGGSSSRQGALHSLTKLQQQQQRSGEQQGIRSRGSFESWQQHEQQQQQQRPASVMSDGAGSRSALEELLEKLNEGQPSLQDLAQLEGLL
ncbi:hypothetical protein OEZ86_004103 [Tetradesmus obliquus]|nr:hypothetical protein OEZ86_004103 [Tetradesmus obliquus]